MKVIYLLMFTAQLFNCCSTGLNKSSENSIIEQYMDSTDINKNLINNHKARINSDSVLISNSKISNDGYLLNVKSFYKKEIVNFKNERIDKVVLKQELLFLLRGKELNKFEYPVKKLKVINKKGNTFEVQENFIYEISIINGQNSWLYKITGNGASDRQSEFNGLYSAEGKLLWSSYASNNSKNPAVKVFGDLDKVMKKFNISETQIDAPVRSIELGLFF